MVATHLHPGRHGPHRVLLSPRLARSPPFFTRPPLTISSGRFSRRHFLSLDRYRLPSLGLRRGLPHRPHGSAHSPDARRSSARPPRRSLSPASPRAPAMVCTLHSWSLPPLAPRAVPREISHSSSPLLDSRLRRSPRLARSFRIRTRSP